MGLNIEDGKGRGFNASVSESNRLNVSAKTNPRTFYVSRNDGLSFIADSVDTSADAGDYVLYLKNTSSTKLLYIKEVVMHSVNAAFWKIWQVSGTASGTTVTATNLNLSSSLVSETTIVGDGAVSGLTTVNLLGAQRNGAVGCSGIEYEDALILGPNDAIAVEYDTGTTGAAEAHVIFHFESIDRNN